MYFAKYYTPSLTTVRQDCEKIGYTAAIRLIEVINNKENVQRENYVDCELIVRDSTKNKKE